mmetsp:Transcript_20882/g.62239  ORF Transcript_20882/g.62239 Transcript_20882/m.62239 type:complete len:321 (+) Transcript_20882:507-1469(+)
MDLVPRARRLDAGPHQGQPAPEEQPLHRCEGRQGHGTDRRERPHGDRGIAAGQRDRQLRPGCPLQPVHGRQAGVHRLQGHLPLLQRAELPHVQGCQGHLPPLQRLAHPRGLPLHAAHGGHPGHLPQPHQLEGRRLVRRGGSHPEAAQEAGLPSLADPDLRHGRHRELPPDRPGGLPARIQLLRGEEDPLLRGVPHAAHHLVAGALRDARPQPREDLGRGPGERGPRLVPGRDRHSRGRRGGGFARWRGRGVPLEGREGRPEARARPDPDPHQGWPSQPVQPVRCQRSPGTCKNPEPKLQVATLFLQQKQRASTASAWPRA